jgi:hypothetical protein
MKAINPSLPPKLIALITAYEGGGIAAGNFDGQLLSWGPFQWNVGQRTLQPLLKRIRDLNRGNFIKLMTTDAAMAVTTQAGLVAFVKGKVLTADGRVKSEWRNRFATLALTREAMIAFSEFSSGYLARAAKDATSLGFETERGLAFCLDVAVQNGGIRLTHRLRYAAAVRRAKPSTEWQKLKLLAAVIADCARAEFREDVFSRKLTIAVGDGTVHQHRYVLERDFGISYDRLWAVPAVA